MCNFQNIVVPAGMHLTLYLVYLLYKTSNTKSALLTLTDHSSIIRRSTDASGYEVAMITAEQVCFSTSTLDTTYSRRLGGVAECTTCYSNSTCVYACLCVCMFVCIGVMCVNLIT